MGFDRLTFTASPGDYSVRPGAWNLKDRLCFQGYGGLVLSWGCMHLALLNNEPDLTAFQELWVGCEAKILPRGAICLRNSSDGWNSPVLLNSPPIIIIFLGAWYLDKKCPFSRCVCMRYSQPSDDVYPAHKQEHIFDTSVLIRRIWFSRTNRNLQHLLEYLDSCEISTCSIVSLHVADS